jgi:uncharacterized membrane protein
MTRLVTAALSLVLTAPASAFACAVCGLAGTQENWRAYRAMTWMMSGLPLAMIAGVGFWIYRRASARDASPLPPDADTGRDPRGS